MNYPPVVVIQARQARPKPMETPVAPEAEGRDGREPEVQRPGYAKLYVDGR